MKPPFNKEFEESLRRLEKSIRLRPKYQEQLRNRVINPQLSIVKTKNERIWLSVAATITLLVGTSPLYSPTMAALAAKIIPLEIKANNSSNPESVAEGLRKIVEESGYQLSSLGSTPNPFSIHVTLMEGNESLSDMKKVLEPKIEEMLDDKGIDQYDLTIDLYKVSDVILEHESDDIMEKLLPVINEAFAINGLEGTFTGFGLTPIEQSYRLEIDMPDHISEDEIIKQYVMDFIEKEELNVAEIKLNYFNVEHRERDSRWGTISSDIYHALAGKSIYNVTGLSYKVKDGKATVNIKTALKEEPTEAISTEIETAIIKYLNLAEIKEQIVNDEYEINLLSKDKEVLLEIKN